MSEMKAPGTSNDECSKFRMDGMGAGAARIAISRSLRLKIRKDYDLFELENKGRYYAAKACSKDGRWFFELLIDKQTGSFQGAGQTERRR